MVGAQLDSGVSKGTVVISGSLSVSQTQPLLSQQAKGKRDGTYQWRLLQPPTTTDMPIEAVERGRRREGEDISLPLERLR